MDSKSSKWSLPAEMNEFGDKRRLYEGFVDEKDVLLIKKLL